MPRRAALEEQFREAGCVVVSMTKVTRRKKGEYAYAVRVETNGACLHHNGQSCQRYETLYSYQPAGILLDPQGIYRKTYDDLIGIDITDPDRPSLAGARSGAPVPTRLRTSRQCYRLFDQLEAVGAI